MMWWGQSEADSPQSPFDLKCGFGLILLATWTRRDNLYWPIGSSTNMFKPHYSVSCRDFPIRGMQIYDGPINVQNCTFRKYVALDGRHTSAFGFRLNNSWQSCPNNNVSAITFDDVPVRSNIRVTPLWECPASHILSQNYYALLKANAWSHWPWTMRE